MLFFEFEYEVEEVHLVISISDNSINTFWHFQAYSMSVHTEELLFCYTRTTNNNNNNQSLFHRIVHNHTWLIEVKKALFDSISYKFSIPFLVQEQVVMYGLENLQSRCAFKVHQAHAAAWSDKQMAFLRLSITQMAVFGNRSILSIIGCLDCKMHPIELLKVSKIKHFLSDHIRNFQ